MSRHRLSGFALWSERGRRWSPSATRFLAASVLALGVLVPVTARAAEEADSRPVLRVSDASVVEPAAGLNVDLEFAVTLSAGLTETLSVDFSTLDPSGEPGEATPGEDFLAQSGVLVFEPGVTALTVRVPVIGDGSAEEREALSLRVEAAAVVQVFGLGIAIGTIDDDPGPAEPEDDKTLGVTVTGARVEDGDTTRFAQGRVVSSPAGIACRVRAPFPEIASVCSADFEHGSKVQLTAQPSDSVVCDSGEGCRPGGPTTFAGWGGACASAGGSLTCTVTMDQARSVTAAFGFDPVQLTVAATGTLELSDALYYSSADGRVTSSPAGIDCASEPRSAVDSTRSDCQELYVPGQSVTLTAVPGTALECSAASLGCDYSGPARFLGWGGACASAGTSATCTVTMTQARSVTAEFGSGVAPLTVTATGEGGFSAGGYASAGGRVTSSPAGIDCASEPRSPVDSSPSDCSEYYALGQSVTLTAVPGNALECGLFGCATLGPARFLGWGGACASAGTSSTCTVTMDQARSVTAEFGSGVAPLTVTATGEGGFSAGGYASAGGRVTSSPAGIDCASEPRSPVDSSPSDCSDYYALGQSVTLTAVPGNALECGLFGCATLGPARFLGWGGACASAGTSSTCTVTMDQARFVTAEFGSGVAPLTVTATGEGGLSAGGYATAGGRVTSSPAGIDCASEPRSPVDSSPSDCSDYYALGQSVTLTAVPGNALECGLFGCATLGPAQFLGWGGACASAGTSSTCTVTMDQARFVTAEFGSGVAPLTVSASAEQGYGGTAESPAIAVAGGRVTSSPAGIDCASQPQYEFYPDPSDCSQIYDLDTSVTLRAEPGFVQLCDLFGCRNSLDEESAAFLGWGGACASAGTSPTCTVTMDEARSVTAAFGFVPKRPLSLSITGEIGSSRLGVVPVASGRVSSSGGALDCRTQPFLTLLPNQNYGTCQAEFNQGSLVTLTATPTAVYSCSTLTCTARSQTSVFAGWTGACDQPGTPISRTCTVTVGEARSVTARFNLPSGGANVD